ncbi:aminotransferase class V-fold PLP-dependent enzyme [Archangium sp.]|uniref:aminotransferase class V-fold PLP-dependent enzyme n=1 Tax=Archangium sp. TaxID=1872627 RepID=UPI002D74EAD3|nr:aminotransferase class V-fold PLP-dependent enzyme [Archangium sp.]HYO53016.1 aminotransferase class V-fold PLP-dependent enzyme [Archangium sp.]
MLSRRNFLLTSALAAGAGAVPTGLAAEKKRRAGADDLRDWGAVRRQFDLDPRYIHLSGFYLTSHPRPVREALESYRQQLEANPLHTVEHLMFGSPQDHVLTKVCNTIASYIGGSGDDIALTQNTTTGLAVIYQGLPLKPGDEILTTTHDHYVHHESIRLAAERHGATWRKIPLFDSYDAISADELVERIQKAIRPETRVVGVTWVHSSSGLKLPIRRMSDAVAEVNRGRAPERRVFFVVDAVHGFGVEEPDLLTMGMDALAVGTHKWIFGPRGTGFAWARPEVWSVMKPMMPGNSAALFSAWAGEKPPAGPARAAWFSPGGFQAFEHYWALPAAFEFHRAIGPARITERIRELNTQMREGLAKMPHVVLYTPRAKELSSGITCFDVKGMTQRQVVQRLLERHKILATTSPYPVSYARLAFGIQNTPEEVEKTLAAIRAMT